jgi:hypothetical protein
MMCSEINKYIKNTPRPIRITKAIYENARPNFEASESARSFFEMILGILVSRYQKEFNTLKVLALEGDHTISQVLDKDALAHLRGYGLIDENHNNYAIKYDVICRYLRGAYRYEQQGLSVGYRNQLSRAENQL